ncbi:DUF5677 domain-containing protein [Bacillus subtilis]|uniref:DUF5677 domain-containing protein n=1 Tax=Bacillus subtilis TaxID=1423 RepID=UPI0024C1B5B8|nr:DUF5677 domain-containing protein [Bacillus subtilis]WHY07564.1 DUF5677 domain-containing protein [Bacillus subtilis]WPP23739.1 DUF5677 domain-containing protein [Bacillus subtilis]
MNKYQKLFDDTLMNIFKEMLEEGKKIDDEKLNKTIYDFYLHAPKSLSNILYEDLKIDMSRMSREEELITEEFESRLHRRWYQGFLILQGIIKICEEISVDLLDEFYVEEHEDKKRQLILQVLFKLHSKSVQLAKEILRLLKSGFSDGALARWRSLHELNVIFKILAYDYQNIDFTYELVNRFLDYSAIESIREMNTYKIATKVLDLDPLTKEEEKEIRIKKNEILKKYGEDFKEPNNWAKPLFPNINNRQLFFSDFEKLVRIDRLTMYYKKANSQIHVSPKGMYQSLSLLNDVKQDSFFLFGASNYGLSLPGQLTGISLSQITTSLILLEPNLDSLIMGATLQKMLDDCKSIFDEIQNEIVNEEQNNKIK